MPRAEGGVPKSGQDKNWNCTTSRLSSVPSACRESYVSMNPGPYTKFSLDTKYRRSTTNLREWYGKSSPNIIRRLLLVWTWQNKVAILELGALVWPVICTFVSTPLHKTSCHYYTVYVLLPNLFRTVDQFCLRKKVRRYWSFFMYVCEWAPFYLVYKVCQNVNSSILR